jgi:hypothetical protein
LKIQKTPRGLSRINKHTKIIDGSDHVGGGGVDSLDTGQLCRRVVQPGERQNRLIGFYIHYIAHRGIRNTIIIVKYWGSPHSGRLGEKNEKNLLSRPRLREERKPVSLSE